MRTERRTGGKFESLLARMRVAVRFDRKGAGETMTNQERQHKKMHIPQLAAALIKTDNALAKAKNRAANLTSQYLNRHDTLCRAMIDANPDSNMVSGRVVMHGHVFYAVERSPGNLSLTMEEVQDGSQL